MDHMDIETKENGDVRVWVPLWIDDPDTVAREFAAHFMAQREQKTGEPFALNVQRMRDSLTKTPLVRVGETATHAIYEEAV